MCRTATIRRFILSLVVNDFGKLGTAFAKTDIDQADLETTMNGLMSDQYSDPVRVVAFNTAEHWSEDAAEYITELPKAEHDTPEWQAAMEALLLVAERDGNDSRSYRHHEGGSTGTSNACSTGYEGQALDTASWRHLPMANCKRNCIRDHR